MLFLAPRRWLRAGEQRTFQHQTDFHTWINPRASSCEFRHIFFRCVFSSRCHQFLGTHSQHERHAKKNNTVRFIIHIAFDCEIYGTKRTETFSKCDWNVFYEPLTASMGSKCEPVFSIKLPSAALNGDKLGFYCVWGCWLFLYSTHSHSLPSSAVRCYNKRKSDIIIIKIENRDTNIVSGWVTMKDACRGLGVEWKKLG